MSVQVSYKKQSIFGIMLLLVLLVPIEGVARTYEYFNPNCFLIEKDAFDKMDQFLVKRMCEDHNSLVFDSRGTILQNVPNQHSQTTNINSYGFRGPEITKEKPNDVYRIFVVGGSTAFGTVSSSDANTIPGFLQQKFDKITDLKVEVINAGIPGHYSAREKYHIENVLIDFEPDLFIIYDGANDARYRILNPLEEKNVKENNDDELDTFTYEDFIDLIRFYRTAFVVKSFMNEIDIEDEFAPDRCFGEDRKCPPSDPETLDKTVSLWKNRLLQICKSGKEHGYSTFVALQPMVGTGNKTLSPDEYRFKPHSEHGFAVMRILDEMGMLIDDLGEVCDRAYDLGNVFDNVSEPVFYDDLHVTDYGNEIIAQKLFELSLPILKESGSRIISAN